MPVDNAASVCPLDMESTPALVISARYADAYTERVTAAEQKSDGLNPIAGSQK